MLSRLGSVSAKAISIVILLIILSVVCSTALLLRHFQQILGPERLAQNLAAAEQIINPGSEPYQIKNGKLYAGSHLLSGNQGDVSDVTSAFGGVMTVFQGRTRVATNILGSDGQSAVGTKLADGPAYSTVFGEGKIYVGKTSILGAPYVSAYKPLKNASGQVVGALFVGFPQAEFNKSFVSAEKIAAYTGLALIIIGGLIGVFCFGRLLSPFRALGEVMEDAKAGRMTTDVPYAGRKDEFGKLARLMQDFNQSTLAFHAREKAQHKAEAEAMERLKAEEAAAQQRNEALVLETFGAGLEALAQGNLSYRLVAELPAVYRGLQENFNSAISAFEASRKAEAEAKLRVDAEREEAARQQIAAAHAAQQDAMDLVVSSFGASIRAMAGRDLSHRVTADLPDGYDQLKKDFNLSLDQLAQVIDDLELRAADIASHTNQLSSATQDMAQRTERQAASLEETAAAMEEVSANVKKSAENATEASKSAADANKSAEQGNAVAKNTIIAMRSIAQSSVEITQIIGVIDDIAFQTNLLALNAGVEAARAGDAGRGFAVVASEVRALAQRSADASKQIRNLIHTSEHQVENGVKLVEQCGEELDGIVNDVSRINILMTEIATAQQEQANAFAEINSAISSMDQTTQQSAAMNEESTAASSAIAHYARELADLTDSFVTGRRAEDRLSARDDAAPAVKIRTAPRPKAEAKPVAEEDDDVELF